MDLQKKVDELEKENEHLKIVINSLEVTRSKLLHDIKTLKCMVFLK